jgi:CSLREA domain-containing protein
MNSIPVGRRTTITVAIAAITAILLVLIWSAPTTAAGPFVVNVTDDTSDGVCDVTHCSLRDAIEAVNAAGELSRIEFDVPVSDPGYSTSTATFLLRPTSPLPAIDAAVVIDGYTQPGSLMNGTALSAGLTTQLKVELNGAGVSTGTPGLIITSGSSNVSGLIITGFPGEAVRIDGGDRNLISGNFIGVGPDGQVANPNLFGVRIIESSGNTIGGITTSAANLISGNLDTGIVISGGLSSGNRVLGNLIGSDRTGASDLGNEISGLGIFDAPNNQIGEPGAGNVISGNHRAGIQMLGAGSDGNIVQSNLIGVASGGMNALGNLWAGVMIVGAPNNTIGGSGTGLSNVISSNQAEGISIFDPASTGNRIEGNLIGLASDGSTALGNFLQGVAIWGDATQNFVGGLSADQGNTIAENGAGGIRIESGDRNSILSNLIYENFNIGIDLNFDGVTLNDAIDSDGGANQTQNFPILNSASQWGSGTAVRGTLNAAESTAFTVQFFSTPTCDIALHGEGDALLETIAVTTNSQGAATLDRTIPVSLSVGTSISAIATDDQGNSSEFGRCVQVIAEPTTSVGGIISSNLAVGEPIIAASAVLTVELEGGGTVQASGGANGRYWVTGLPVGKHGFVIDADNHLPARITGVAITGGLLRLPNVELIVGDLDDTGGIDINDMLIVASYFGAITSTTTDSSGRLIDIDGDGVVSIRDISKLATQFGVSGDQPWSGDTISPDPRYGIVLHTLDPTEQDELLARIGSSWILDAGYDPILPALGDKIMWVGSLDGLNGAEPGPSPTELAEAANLHRGATWMLANEPNRRDSTYNVTNVIDELHDSWEAIKAADPTALIVSPPVLNFLFTCLGQGCGTYPTGTAWWNEFVSEYLNRYGEEPPIDIWAINAYPLLLNDIPTVNPVVTTNQVLGFRGWLDSRPASNGKPIWVTEFGAQWGYAERDLFAAGCGGYPKPKGAFQTDAVNQYLADVYDWFETNATQYNIQRWFQYIAYQDTSTCNADAYAGPTLFEGPATDAALTPAGELFRDRIVGMK